MHGSLDYLQRTVGSPGARFRAEARHQRRLFRDEADANRQQFSQDARRPPSASDINRFAQWYAKATPEQRALADAREGHFTLRTDLLDRSQGQPNIELQQRHVRGGLLPEENDPNAEWDLMVAKAITRVLLSHYRGHFWVVEANRAQGVAWISIPILLGEWKYIFHLREDITPAMIIRAGGLILERFNIPRSSLDVASFIAAKKMAGPRGGNLPA